MNMFICKSFHREDSFYTLILERGVMSVIWIQGRGGDECLLDPTEREMGDECHLDPREKE